jgi:hypothetical protein
MLARLLKTLLSRVALLVGFLRFGNRLRERLCAEATLRQPEIVQHKRMFGQVLIAGERLELLDRSVVIFFGPLNRT